MRVNKLVNETGEQLMKLAINKSILKEYPVNYRDCVYMNEGDEFQIMLFNPLKTVISARVYLNGTRLSNDIVLQPGQRVWLERYLDTPNKFKFTTYEVEANNEIVEAAIANNGVVKVEFFHERVNSHESYTIYDPITWTASPYLFHEEYTTANGPISGHFTLSMLNTAESQNNTAESQNCIIKGFGRAFNPQEISGSIENIDTKYCFNSADTIETGRITEGSHSSQKFESVYKDFDYSPFKTIEKQILPMSRKPITKNDIQKVYCSACGRKLNTKYKYCPYCGEKVD